MRRASAFRTLQGSVCTAFRVFGIFFGVTMAVVLFSARSVGATPVASFDENGNFTSQGVSNSGMFFFTGTDPVDPASGTVLIYRLGFVVTPGEVTLSNPSEASSDVVRFLAPGFFTDPGSSY
ncbi:MAG TPA: hypothetical protein VNA31_02290, partial [bacterium]|nr:hypothetical protein [bacterium]